MIFDFFENIDLYNIDETVKNFILNINSDIEAGRHKISDHAFVNIDNYKTRNEIKLEAHRKYIDIQFLIYGAEKVYTTDLAGLDTEVEYSEEKDIMFFKIPKKPLNQVFLNKGKFVVLYPDDVHSPCMAIDAPQEVKKAIVKIEIQ